MGSANERRRYYVTPSLVGRAHNQLIHGYPLCCCVLFCLVCINISGPEHSCDLFTLILYSMMTSSNGNIFRVTGTLWGNSLVTGGFPSQRPVTRSFDVFFDQRLNKRLSKRSGRRWFETQSRALWFHCHELTQFPQRQWVKGRYEMIVKY